jgi:hypothetical protein
MPYNAEFAKNMSLSILNQAVSLQVQKIVAEKYANTLSVLRYRQDHRGEKLPELTDAQKSDIYQMESIQAALSVLGGVLNAYMNDGKDFKSIYRCYSGDQTASDDCIRSSLNVLSSFGGEYYIDKGLSSLTGEQVNLPILSVASMTYDLYQGEYEDVAWDAASIGATAIVQSAATSASWAGPVGIAIGVAVQLVRISIEIIIANDKSFDVGWVEVNPWALGVSGYLGMLGTNHDPQRSTINNRFNRKWQETSSTSIGTDSAGNEITSEVFSNLQESRHPMADMQLVGTDGGASRFILSDDSIQTDNQGRRWVSYVSLSNVDRRKVYYCLPSGPDTSSSIDLGTDPTQEQIINSQNNDTTGFYLVKDGDGNQVYFRTKGIDSDFSGTSTYWSVPTGSRNGIGDSIAVRRDANQNLIAAWDVRTNRGIMVGRSPLTVLSRAFGGLPPLPYRQILGASSAPMTSLASLSPTLPLAAWNDTIYSGILQFDGQRLTPVTVIDKFVSHFEEQAYEAWKPILHWFGKNGVAVRMSMERSVMIRQSSIISTVT